MDLIGAGAGLTRAAQPLDGPSPTLQAKARWPFLRWGHLPIIFQRLPLHPSSGWLPFGAAFVVAHNSFQPF